ncbi:hypothetical protein GF406_22915 [candidate division KSB1 bacterium]|nr:hypothetical protein [candidate division KSB1 bacterium]
MQTFKNKCLTIGSLCLMISLIVLSFTSMGFSGPFRASAIKINITPTEPVWLLGFRSREHPSTAVHDSLYLKILCLDDGETRFFLVSADICEFDRGYLYESLLDSITKTLDIPREHFIWTTTHTHSGPYVSEKNREYQAWLERTLIQGLLKAENALVPARFGYENGIALANMNRRVWYPHGKVGLGKNPAKPIDRSLGVIKIERSDGMPLALVVRYAMHGTTMYARNYQISADAMGITTQYVENHLNIPVLFMNGAAGNLDPIFSYRDEFQARHFDMACFQKLLGEPVLTIQSMISTNTRVKMQTTSTLIPLPCKKKFIDQNGETLSVPVHYLKINDLMIYSAPLELFCEIAMQIQDQSPFKSTWFFGYANDFLGYLATASAYPEGGYEVGDATFYDKRAQAVFQRKVLSTLKELYP